MRENLKMDFLMELAVAGITVEKCEKAILFVEFQPLTTKF